MRYRRGDRLTSVRTGLATFELYLQTPTTNATHAFRTVQVYSDGHETRFTEAAGTAPSIEVVGGSEASSDEPQAEPTPTATPGADPEPTTSPDQPTAEPDDTGTGEQAPDEQASDDPASPVASPRTGAATSRAPRGRSCWWAPAGPWWSTANVAGRAADGLHRAVAPSPAAGTARGLGRGGRGPTGMRQMSGARRRTTRHARDHAGDRADPRPPPTTEGP